MLRSANALSVTNFVLAVSATVINGRRPPLPNQKRNRLVVSFAVCDIFESLLVVFLARLHLFSSPFLFLADFPVNLRVVVFPGLLLAAKVRDSVINKKMDFSTISMPLLPWLLLREWL